MPERPIQVLLVDDERDYYILTRDLLAEVEDQLYQLDWKASYPSGLDALAGKAYDVCLLDYNLGRHTGLDLLRSALAQGYAAPMIMLTGQGDHAVDLEAMQIGAVDYLSKGRIDAASLDRAIRYAIERARTLKALRESERQIAHLYQKEQERTQELERAYADLRAAERLRDDLTHMIVHDLRSPLTAILGNLNIIARSFQRPALAASAPEYLASALSAAQRMKGMIDDLLNMSKFEAGELQPALTSLSLAALLAERAATYRPQIEGEGKLLVMQLPAQLPDVTADAELIGRVIDNLISNAVKYTDSGGHIEVGARAEDQAVTVYVRDDGEGIRLEYHARIFEKFIQVTNTQGVPLRRGTGLGLAFCKLAVEAHGGTIHVDSTPGEGSTFSFTLPRAPA